MNLLLSILSFLFVMAAPFLLGAFLPLLLMGVGLVPADGMQAVGWFAAYIVVYFWIWGSYLDCGRKLKI